MTREANDILKKALALPAEDRAELAGALVESLDSPLDVDAAERWHKEIDRRIHDLDSGKAKTYSLEEVRAWLAAKFHHEQ